MLLYLGFAVNGLALELTFTLDAQSLCLTFVYRLIPWCTCAVVSTRMIHANGSVFAYVKTWVLAFINV